ncbi:MAG TPA: lysophospholipid acyltransferase family protein [Acidimicrobiales bacterium]
MANGDERYGWLFPVAKIVLPPVVRFAWRIHTEGLENLPDDGPAILCPNHTSVLDSFLLPAALLPIAGGRRIMFVGKAEYMDSWKTRHVFPALGMIPIDRSGGDSAQRALDLAADVLDRGDLFGIYPEGTRSRDGRLYKGHTGPARLALRTGAPLIPVGIVGSRRIQPPEAKLPRVFEPCAVRVGKPIRPEHYRGHTDGAGDRLVLRQMIDELMFEIRSLSGQDYIDEYATRRRDAAVETPVARSSADVLSRA